MSSLLGGSFIFLKKSLASLLYNVGVSPIGFAIANPPLSVLFKYLLRFYDLNNWDIFVF